MVQRVVYGALPGGGHGLRVSRPGYNVLNANLQPNQVSFDSRWPNTLKVFMTGTRTSVGTVNFGKTFAAPPMVFVAISISGRYTGQMVYGQYGGEWGPGKLDVSVFRDRVVFGASIFPLTYAVVIL